MEGFFSGYARLRIKVLRQLIFTCSFEVKMHTIHKNRVQTKIQQQYIVLVNKINQSFIL